MTVTKNAPAPSTNQAPARRIARNETIRTDHIRITRRFEPDDAACLRALDAVLAPAESEASDAA